MKTTYKIMLISWGIICCCSCKKTEKRVYPPELVPSVLEIDWAKAADAGQLALFNQFYTQSQHYFLQNNNGHEGFNYWWNAHAMDVYIDAYNRTKDAGYLVKMKELLHGCYVKNGNKYLNSFYDDMEWWALACLRAYDATGDQEYKNVAQELWGYIKKGWTEVKNGGIMWASGPSTRDSKNACSNAPAVIIAARLYQLNKNEDDLLWAKKIYTWMRTYLVEPERGVVWDAYGNSKETDIYTYNQGTFLGAGLELFLITGKQSYLDDAIRNANYVMNDRLRFSPSGVLKGENSGDGGLFKGIFIRYMVQLLMKGGLDDYTKELYGKYLVANGQSLYTKATRLPSYTFGTDWVTKPSSTISDCSVQLSGIMLFEALDELKRKQFLK